MLAAPAGAAADSAAAVLPARKCLRLHVMGSSFGQHRNVSVAQLSVNAANGKPLSDIESALQQPCQKLPRRKGRRSVVRCNPRRHRGAPRLHFKTGCFDTTHEPALIELRFGAARAGEIACFMTGIASAIMLFRGVLHLPATMDWTGNFLHDLLDWADIFHRGLRSFR
jgi:hypothetical protein